jgi:uncharacterized protein YbjT (DUF2867 family)
MRVERRACERHDQNMSNHLHLASKPSTSSAPGSGRILVTGATGNIGGRVAQGLVALGQRPRVMVRDPGRARSLFGDRVDCAVGDLADEASLAAAFADTDAAFLVNDGPDLAGRDGLAARVARAAGVGHLVKLSSLGARAAGGPPTAVALWHAGGEAAIQDSGVPYTFIRSVGFMSNALAWAPSIRAAGVVRSSAGEGRIAMIHPDDLAAVAIAALVTGAHRGEALAVTGPEALTYAEMTALIGAAIGRSLTFVPLSDDEARANLARTGMPPATIDALVVLWREVREGQVAVVTGDVERVTGRKPIAFRRWAEENAAAFR